MRFWKGLSIMRVAICGRNLEDLLDILAAYPVEVVETDPDVVISYGGDGALLGGERDFPGVTKCPIRDRRSNPKCEVHTEEFVLDALLAGRLAQCELIKLVAAEKSGPRVVGINDVMISKEVISSAVRYRLWLDDVLHANQIVGDGLVIATPFGSTGYYRSITHSMFRVGIGLAFNNSTETLDHLVVDSDTVIVVEIIRGPAVLLADNDSARVRLNQGDCVTVRRSPGETLVLGLDVFRCPRCYQLRQQLGS